MIKTTRTRIADLQPATSLHELTDEQLVRASGGSTSFGTTCWTASWNMMDVDSPIYDSGSGSGHLPI